MYVCLPLSFPSHRCQSNDCVGRTRMMFNPEMPLYLQQHCIGMLHSLQFVHDAGNYNNTISLS